MNEIFELAVTVTNLSDIKRELRLIIPAQNWSSVLDAIQPVDRHTAELEHKVRSDREQREKDAKVVNKKKAGKVTVKGKGTKGTGTKRKRVERERNERKRIERERKKRKRRKRKRIKRTKRKRTKGTKVLK